MPDRSAGGAVAGGAIAALVSRQPDAVLGLATGSSPEPVYADIVARHQAGSLSFRQARAFLLDEYVGLPPDHPQSYRAVIEREVTSRLDFRPQSVRGPDGNAEDLLAACATYDAQITAADGVDLQLLGIGSDGHIGFNEPGSSLGSRTRLKTLTSRTRADNARFDVPVAEPVGHQAPSFVIAAGLLASCLAVFLLQDADQTVQGLDNDGPAAAGIGPVGGLTHRRRPSSSCSSRSVGARVPCSQGTG